MQPEQYQNIAAFCEDVTYDVSTGELRGKRHKFEANLDNVLINRRRVDKGRIIAMLVYGYPHLLQPAAHLDIDADDDARWALGNLRYTYEPEARNPLGLAEGGIYFVRGGVTHRLFLPVGTTIMGHTVVSPSAEDISAGSFVLDANSIMPSLTTNETPMATPVAHAADDNPAPPTEEPEVDEDDYGDYDDLV